jgi:RNA polymerase sigma-70 factor, ECF subfamily
VDVSVAKINSADIDSMQLVKFKAALIDVLPALRAFARSLCHDPTEADDLVQETMLKAWAARNSYIEDASFKAWTFRILRNILYSDRRKSRYLVQLDTPTYEATARATVNIHATIELSAVTAAIQTLPLEQREALILIAAGGFSNEEVAGITGLAVGTIKSRVSRGRASLVLLMDKTSGHRPLQPQSADEHPAAGPRSAPDSPDAEV